MNRFNSLWINLAVILLTCITTAQAQEICLVTADFEDGEDYIVIWQPFTDYSGMDSIYVYRKAGTENLFTKVGAVKAGPSQPSYFRDQTANTIDTTKYAIAILDSSGMINPRSPWHQAVVMDYQGNGEFIWTAYKKEDQINEDYIYGYTFMVDASGFGNFSPYGMLANDEFWWLDEVYDLQPEAQYAILTSLPYCEFNTKANINTSRSNIKQQYANGSAGIKVLTAGSWSVGPNPAKESLTVTFAKAAKNTRVWVSTVNGEVIAKQQVNGVQCELDVHSLAAGVYLVHVEDNGVINTRKWVKY